MKEHPKDVMVDKFQEAVVHVLEQRSGGELRLESIDAATVVQQFGVANGRDEVFSSYIELRGPELRSSLTVLTAADTASQLAPTACNSLVDAIGELGNLLMGSIKNSLVAYRMNPSLGIPSSKNGPDMRFVSDLSDYVVVAADTIAGTVCVALNFDISSANSWEFDPRLAAADEGVVCFF